MRINGVNPTLNVRPPKLDPVQPSKVLDSSLEGLRKPAYSQREQELQEQPINVSDVQEAVDEINKALHYMNERLEFSVHEETNRIIVRVLDRETEEVLREIPPEQILDLVAKLQELVGLLVDKRA